MGAFLLVQTTRAGLVWERQSVTVQASPEDGVVNASYAYKNTGDRPVKFLSMRPSCGCTAARPSEQVVAPGASGEVGLKFDIGDRQGRQYKTVTVETDDPDKPTTVLALEVLIQQAIEMDRTVLLWRVGEPAEAKTIHLKVTQEAPLTLAGAKVVGEGFDAALETDKEGREYSLVVTPKGTTVRAAATLQVEAAASAGHVQTFTARARVK